MMEDTHLCRTSSLGNYSTKRWSGEYECDIWESNTDSAEAGILSKKKCRKNPGHPRFIPVREFTINHLPEQLRDPLVFDLVKAWAGLTVRLRVKTTSSAREPGYPFAGLGEKVTRTGTGLVMVTAFWNPIRGRCPAADCCGATESEEQDTDLTWYSLQICTAKHVVFDDCEAGKTDVEFFYDVDEESEETADGVAASGSSQRQRRVAHGIDVTQSSIDHDYCWFRCSTHDKNLAEELGQLHGMKMKLMFQVGEKYKGKSDNTSEMIHSNSEGAVGTVPGQREKSRNVLDISSDSNTSTEINGVQTASSQVADTANECRTKAAQPNLSNLGLGKATSNSADCSAVNSSVPDLRTVCIIISHPHGCSKQITVGHVEKSVEIEKTLMRSYQEKQYTADTCPGSSGTSIMVINVDPKGDMSVLGIGPPVPLGNANEPIHSRGGLNGGLNAGRGLILRSTPVMDDEFSLDFHVGKDTSCENTRKCHQIEEPDLD